LPATPISFHDSERFNPVIKDLSPRLALSDGFAIPQLGLGVYKVEDREARDTVSFALQHGYRLVDTAAMYENEVGVGEGLKRSGVPREELFVTTKFWMDDLGYEKTLAAAKKSLERLGLDYLDLYMIHWPAPERGLFTESWRAMEKLQGDGLIRSIGVSNFHPEHLDQIFAMASSPPVINQVEMHPWLTQDAVLAYNSSRGIVSQAWSPLARGQVLDSDELADIGAKYAKSVSQTVLRWHLQRGYGVVPKSVREERVLENIDVFDFALSTDEMNFISSLNRNFRTGVDPNDRN
jgi:2,5-diketo-D-gluconate reductase A